MRAHIDYVTSSNLLPTGGFVTSCAECGQELSYSAQSMPQAEAYRVIAAHAVAAHGATLLGHCSFNTDESKKRIVAELSCTVPEAKSADEASESSVAEDVEDDVEEVEDDLLEP